MMRSCLVIIGGQSLDYDVLAPPTTKTRFHRSTTTALDDYAAGSPAALEILDFDEPDCSNPHAPHDEAWMDDGIGLARPCK